MEFLLFVLFVGLFANAFLLADARGRLKALEAWQRKIALGADPAATQVKPPVARLVTRSAALRTAPPPDPETPTVSVEVKVETVEIDLPLVPAPEPVAPPADPIIPEKRAAKSRGGGFEELFGRRLPIWAGGATLAVAGVLLVKYSIDVGLLSPTVRVVLGLLFGAGLIAGAETALRYDARVQDPRIRQALAGAGLATLYAATLAAANLYMLIGPATAFVGLAGITALAMALSLRFGAPCALLGLVGGLAAPALVSAGPPNIPLLSAYLALAIGGLCAVSRKQRWAWLGVAALVGGAGWGAILILAGGLDIAASLSLGLLLLVLGVALPALVLTGNRSTLLQGGAALVAAAQMAALVATGGFGMLNWGLYGLLSVAMAWLSGRDRKLRAVPAVGLAVGLMLTMLWQNPAQGEFTLVLLAMAAIYSGFALVRLWRPAGGMIEAGQIAATALGGYAVAFGHFYPMGGEKDTAFALLALAAAALPANGAGLGWNNAKRREDARFATLAMASAVLVTAAGAIGMPVWTLPIGVAAVASALLLLSNRAEDARIGLGALSGLFLAIVCLLASDPMVHELMRLFGESGATDVAQACLRWASVAAAMGLFAWRGRVDTRQPIQALAALAAYGAVAQIVPPAWLAIAVALTLLGLVATATRVLDRLRPAMVVLVLLVGLWALEPFGLWLQAAVESLRGMPMLATSLPDIMLVAQRLVGPAILLVVALWRGAGAIDARLRRGAAILAAIMGGVALHIGYKQIFHLSDSAEVVRFALAERTIWEALLLATAFGAWRTHAQRRAALILVAAAVGHNLWYSMIALNPLWSEQAVGAMPIANLLLPAFAVPFIGLLLVDRIAPDVATRFARLFDILRMALIALFAFMSLRQLFSGTLLQAAPVDSVESIGRSVLALALAVGYLLWGIRKGLQDWRIASLILMIGAVAKVFLVDADGLEGLLRIASFLALGFSLIGVGWLYSKYLRIGAGGAGPPP